jgi:hypothetical protein
VRGEFRLVSLAGGRTRLEGGTWYELDPFPRVLAHVKRLSEADSLSRE